MTIFYHGNPSPKKMRKIRNICPSLEHRVEWTPDTLRERQESYFLDNGAFTQDFDPDAWRKALEKMSELGREPDFVVLPDSFDEPEETHRKHLDYVSDVREKGFDYYYVAQKGIGPGKVARRAKVLEAKGIFIGGSWHKPRVTPGIVEEARKKGLKVHIGMPHDFFWAARSGADSFDSVSIVRNQAWDRLERLEDKLTSQQTL